MKKIFVYMMMTGIVLSSCNKKEITAGYDGKDLTETAQVIRDKGTKAARIEISTEENWTLYAGTSVETIDFSAPLLTEEGGGSYTLEVPDSVRSYFQLITPTGKALLAETHLPMTGGYNFRDLGGIRTQDNRYVKWGKLIRSDDMHSLTDADLTYLSSLPLISIVDFRSNDEREAAPDRRPSSVKESYPYAIAPGNMSDISAIFGSNVDSLMEQMNIEMVTDPLSIKRYKDFFALLQNDENAPLLYHCSAGKDRTGMATALILSALGVDEDTILANYLESNVYLGDKYAEYTKDYPQLKALFEVKPNYITAGLNRIKEDYGSIENYLRQVLEVDIDLFRSLYLY